MFQVPLCLHVAGDKNHYKREWDTEDIASSKWKRVCWCKIVLVASALGFGGHSLLGFDANICDEIYKMNHDFGSVIDIGTAQGCLPVQIAVAHPHIRGGGFDLPPVRQAFERYVRTHELSDRLHFYAGDFFDDPFPSADVLVLGHVLHDWDLSTKKMLLKKAHDALPAGGALIVYDMMIDDARRTNVAGPLMSLNMLIETSGGFDYTGADCIGWMRESDFATARVEPLVGPHSMVVGIK